jgi:uncharacterized SAM-binding protein YcdF (DUF218 family)
VGKLLRGTKIVFAAVGLLLVIVTTTPLVTWWARALAGPWNDPSGDVLIVLGGSVHDNGIMGESTYWRSVYGVLVYRTGGFRDVLLSGGASEGPAVAESMRRFLVCEGVPSQVIHVELHSRSTRENALYATQALATLAGTKVLLTSDYHMTRAYRSFRKVGLDVVPRPVPDAIKRASSFGGRWQAFVDVVTETFTLGYYFARGWV